jgi:hypothetical protein
VKKTFGLVWFLSAGTKVGIFETFVMRKSDGEQGY